MHEAIDNYCERLDATFWSEPINAITNLAFIVAGLLVLNEWRNSRRSAPVLFLGVWICVIGFGSFLFHTIATGWSAVADSLPILVFILVYLYLAVRSYLGWPLWGAILVVVAFLPAGALLAFVMAPLVGSSSGYMPALAAIFVVGFMMRNRDADLSAGLLVTGIVFTASIGFRMADEPLCSDNPLGTHFMWHILNSVVLYRLAMHYLDWNERRHAAPDSSEG